MTLPSSPGTYGVLLPVSTSGALTIATGKIHLYVNYGTGKWVAKAGCEITVAGYSYHKTFAFISVDAISALAGLINIISSWS